MQDVPAVAMGRVPRPPRVLRLAGDERLVALLRAGDERAFEAIWERHHRPLLGFCRHMLGSQQDAEDAVQHTFAAAYRELLAHERPIHLRAWLFTIARNRCLSLLRARREHVALDAAEPSTEGLAAAVQRREDVRELLGDLARLPEQQRAALLLSELGALDHDGIAAVLGCRREQVKALVFQARSSLAADREARAIPCEQIRTQLASARGAALRRGPLRRHLRDCAGCRAFGDEVARQRKLMAVALPVIPSAALKAAVLHGAGGGGHAGAGAAAAAVHGAAGGGAGAAGGAGAGLAGIASAGVAKVAVVVVAAGAIAGGGVLAVHAVGGGERPAAHARPVHAGARPANAPRSRTTSGRPDATARDRHAAGAAQGGASQPSSGRVAGSTGALRRAAAGGGRHAGRQSARGGAPAAGSRAHAPRGSARARGRGRPAGAHGRSGHSGHGRPPRGGSHGSGSAPTSTGPAEAPAPRPAQPDAPAPGATSHVGSARSTPAQP
jgi:RNA polymerase sigma factor (sigma-70 family)